MHNIDLVRFLSDSAIESMGKAETANSMEAERHLSEAEELLSLGMAVLKRRNGESIEMTREAA